MADFAYEIYGLFDPRRPDVLRYIGQTSKGRETRLAGHLKTARQPNGPRYHVTHWIQQLFADGIEPGTLLLVSANTQDEANRWEVDLIAWFRDGGHPLTNMTLGGEGVTFLTEEGRAKQLAALRSRVHTADQRAAAAARMRARWADPEWRAETSRRIGAGLVARADRLNPHRHDPKPVSGPKTHCLSGHPFDDENTYYSPDGDRHCVTCRRNNARARYAAGTERVRRGPLAEHCGRGHVLDEANTYYHRNGDRVCRKCQADWARKRRAERQKPRHRATHCRRGHEFTDDNTYTYRGARKCRTCTLARQRSYRGAPNA